MSFRSEESALINHRAITRQERSNFARGTSISVTICEYNDSVNRKVGNAMLSIVSLLSLALGALGAALADSATAHQDLVETGAGVFLIGGFLLLGSSLPVML